MDGVRDRFSHRLLPENEADLPETDGGDERLEPGTACHAGAGHPDVVVDHPHLTGRPAELLCPGTSSYCASRLSVFSW